MICTPHQYNSGYQIKRNKLGGVYVARVGLGRVHTGFL